MLGFLGMKVAVEEERLDSEEESDDEADGASEASIKGLSQPESHCRQMDEIVLNEEDCYQEDT